MFFLNCFKRLVIIYQFTRCNIPEDLIFSIITVRASNITLYILLGQYNVPEFKSKYLFLCINMNFNYREKHSALFLGKDYTICCVPINRMC